jgi:antitoxin FitA
MPNGPDMKIDETMYPMRKTTMLQIRNVPQGFHCRLKARAAVEGISMSDYILREVGKALDVPTRQEMLERLRARPVRRLKPSPTKIIRAARDSR